MYKYIYIYIYICMVYTCHKKPVRPPDPAKAGAIRPARVADLLSEGT